jgi:DNA-binding NarL/FixJ family response regulator
MNPYRIEEVVQDSIKLHDEVRMVGGPTPENVDGRPTRLLVVDDDIGIRTLLEVSISLDPRFELCGLAGSAEEALGMLRTGCCSSGSGCPDVILLDVTLPDRDGIDLVGEVREVRPNTRVALFTGWSDDATAARAREAGADAVFAKDGEPQRLLDGLAALPRA